MALVEYERRGGIALITLNRPQAKNALSGALRAEFATVLKIASEDADVSAIVLTGAGDAFCAGLDLTELAAEPLALVSADMDDPAINPVRAIELCGKPVIGAINGVAITGGFELALACDVLIASPSARFADTHARVGVMPLWGASQRLSRLIGLQRAKAMSLTGNFVDATTAERWCLVAKLAASEALIDEALALANDVASLPANLVLAYRQLIDDGADLPLSEALVMERQRASEWNAHLTPRKTENARRATLARGRAQSGEPQSD